MSETLYKTTYDTVNCINSIVQYIIQTQLNFPLVAFCNFVYFILRTILFDS